jgi:hypothetical protein
MLPEIDEGIRVVAPIVHYIHWAISSYKMEQLNNLQENFGVKSGGPQGK